MRHSLSLSMIVRNEERHLARCLETAREFADEIVIVDTGSTDATKEIARRHTDRVFDFTWVDDFAKARNYSLQQCTSDFVMYLDADDVFPLEDARRLRAIMNRPVGWDIARLPYLLANDGRGTVTKSARVWRNFVGIRWRYPIHEIIERPPRPVRVEWGIEDVRVWHSPLQVREYRPQKRDRNMRILLRAVEQEEFRDSAHLWAHLAKEFRSNDLPEKAIEAAERAIACDTGRGTLGRARNLILAAEQQRKLGRLDDAVATTGRAIAEYPGWREPFALLAELYTEQHRLADALLVLQLGAQVPKHQYDLGQARYYTAEWSDLIAQVLERRGDLDGALAEIRSGLLREPDNALLIAREAELRGSRDAADSPPRLLSITASVEELHPGDTFVARFSLATERPVRCGLGLSIRHEASGAVLSDPGNDAIVECAAGQGVFERRFQIPETAPEGSYDLLSAIRAIAGDRMGRVFDRASRPGRLRVVPADGAGSAG